MKFLFRNKKRYYLKTENNPDELILTAMTYLQKEIEKAEIHDIRKDGYNLSFKGSIFRYIWNGFNTFNPISEARFSFSQYKNNLVLDVELFFTEVFVTLLLFAPAALVAYFLRGWEYSLLIGLSLFFIYGFTTVIALLRLKYILFNMVNYVDQQYNKLK